MHHFVPKKSGKSDKNEIVCSGFRLLSEQEAKELRAQLASKSEQKKSMKKMKKEGIAKNAGKSSNKDVGNQSKTLLKSNETNNYDGRKIPIIDITGDDSDGDDDGDGDDDRNDDDDSDDDDDDSVIFVGVRTVSPNEVAEIEKRKKERRELLKATRAVSSARSSAVEAVKQQSPVTIPSATSVTSPSLSHPSNQRTQSLVKHDSSSVTSNSSQHNAATYPKRNTNNMGVNQQRFHINSPPTANGPVLEVLNLTPQQQHKVPIYRKSATNTKYPVLITPASQELKSTFATAPITNSGNHQSSPSAVSIHNNNGNPSEMATITVRRSNGIQGLPITQYHSGAAINTNSLHPIRPMRHTNPKPASQELKSSFATAPITNGGNHQSSPSAVSIHNNNGNPSEMATISLRRYNVIQRLPITQYHSGAAINTNSLHGLRNFRHTNPNAFVQHATVPFGQQVTSNTESESSFRYGGHPEQWKRLPPPPEISVNFAQSAIVISWTMRELNNSHASIMSYQIYTYQPPPNGAVGQLVADVEAMLLPMSVILPYFLGSYFVVRAVDVHGRTGPFSAPKTWSI